MKLTIYSSEVAGMQDNCLYPHKHEVTDADSLRAAVQKDHVCAEYRNSYRGKENFIVSDCLVMDVDNDHSEDPREWITPEALAEEYDGIRYAVCFSRHHMKQKGQYSPRPRFHIYFAIEPITDQQEYSDLKAALYAMYPFYDDGALDSGRFIYGSEPGGIVWHEGEDSVVSLLDADPTKPLIREGNRNRYMYRWAVCRLKRDGKTEDTEKAFYEEAGKCVPPLEDKELKTIWRSASGFYDRKVKTDPAYVEPGEFKTGIPSKWEDPIPFGKREVLPFPTEALPEAVGAYAAAVSESVQTPIDMAGCAALAVIAACVQGKFVIKGKADWTEPLNLYITEIAPPSERKSAIQHSMVKPVSDYENNYNLTHAAEVETSRMRRRILERKQKAVEDQASKGNAKQEDVDRIAREIADYREQKPLRLFADDITPEKLASVLAENNGRMALLSSEAGIFDTLAGVYSKSVNIDVMLKSYSGDQIRVDRIGRESENILHPALTILLMAQPNIISKVLSNETFRGRGLTARFLYCMPVSAVGGRRYRSAPVPDETYAAYERCVFNMLEDEYAGQPEIITLSPEADLLLEQFAGDLEPKLVSDYAEIADWCGKLVGNTLRIAGLLCRAGAFRSHDFMDEPEPLVVDVQTMENAIRLGRYFLSHAMEVFNVLPESAMYQNAERILKMISDKDLREFNRRTAMRNCQTFKRAEEIQPVLDFLEDYGYIVQIPQKYAGSGRPPVPKYAVNPRAAECFCQFCQDTVIKPK